MTVQDIEARIAEIDGMIEKVVAQFNMLRGGKEECAAWLAKAKAAEASIAPAVEGEVIPAVSE
jgi:hypothetical protein